MSKKIVHVVGTGTIGEPLIGLLCDFKEQLGIDHVTFHKNTPLTTDRSKVISLTKEEQDYLLIMINLMDLNLLVLNLNIQQKKQLNVHQ